MNIFMDFVLHLPRSKKVKDSIFVVVNSFFKMTNYIACHKTNDTSNITNLFFKEVVHLYDIPKSIVFNHYVKFLSYFWKTLLGKFRIKIFFSKTFYLQINE